jgi:four helix bundle protein
MDARDRTFRDLLPGASCFHLAIDPPGAHVAVSTWRTDAGLDGRVFLYPIDGANHREFRTGWEGERSTWMVAFDATGRQLLASPQRAGDPNDPKCRTFRVWDVESGVGHTVSLPECALPVTFDAQGRVVYTDASGVRRLIPPATTGGAPSSEMLFPFAHQGLLAPTLSLDGRQLLVFGTRREERADTPARRILRGRRTWFSSACRRTPLAASRRTARASPPVPPSIHRIVLALARSMPRDPKKLQVYNLAHRLALEIYRITPRLPASERFGLATQLRRAAVSVPANIVEGSVQRSSAGCARYLEVALGSAVEVRYLLDLVCDLGLVPEGDLAEGRECSDHVSRALQNLLRATATFEC